MKQKGYTLTEMLAVLAILAWLAVFIGGGLVIVHFVAKFW